MSRFITRLHESGIRFVWTYVPCYRCGQFFEENYQKLHNPIIYGRSICPICDKKTAQDKGDE